MRALGYPRTVSSAVARVAAGEAFWQSFGNLMEHLKYTATAAQGSQAFWRRPGSIGDDGLDALVAALAEDLSEIYGVRVPSWCMGDEYRLGPGSEYWDWKPPRARAYLLENTREPYRSDGVFVAPNIVDIA